MTKQVFDFRNDGFFVKGSHEAEVFHNGLKLVVGSHYEELNNTTIRLLSTTLSGDRVGVEVRGRQRNGHPGLYSTEILATDEPISKTFSVPVYTVGNNSLRVYRNGKLLDLASGEYTESGVNQVGVIGPLSSGDIFEFIIRSENVDGAPILLETQTPLGGINEVFTLATPFIQGTETLEVYRNGKKLFNTFGYDELSSTTVRFNGVSLVTDIFTFIVRAQSADF